MDEQLKAEILNLIRDSLSVSFSLSESNESCNRYVRACVTLSLDGQEFYEAADSIRLNDN